MSGIEFTPFIWALPVAAAMMTYDVLAEEPFEDEELTLEQLRLELDKSRRHRETSAHTNSLEELTEDSSIEVTEDSIEVTLDETQA